LLGFDLLACRVVGANEQIAYDGVVRVAQRRDGHHRRKPAAVLADVGQLVDVLDPARGLEHQGLETRGDRRAQFDAERPRARDQLLRIGNVSRRDLVHHVRGRVPQHPLGADVENLDDALGVGGDAREIGAVENRGLERCGVEHGHGSALAAHISGLDTVLGSQCASPVHPKRQAAPTKMSGADRRPRGVGRGRW